MALMLHWFVWQLVLLLVSPRGRHASRQPVWQLVLLQLVLLLVAASRESRSCGLSSPMVVWECGHAVLGCCLCEDIVAGSLVVAFLGEDSPRFS